MCATAYTTAINIQGLIALNVDSYTLPGWHACLMTIAIMVFAIFVNTVLLRMLPLMEGGFVVIYVFAFFAVLVVLWVMGPRGDASVVFTNFEDNAGWGNIGGSTLVGIIAPLVTLIGSDSSCHLSEELQNASYTLPRSMAATALVNYSVSNEHDSNTSAPERLTTT